VTKLDTLQAQSTFKTSFIHDALQCCCFIFRWADLSYWSGHVCVWYYFPFWDSDFDIIFCKDSHNIINILYLHLWGRDSVATGYGLDDRGIGVRVPVGSRVFSSPCRPDRLWGPPSLLSNGYQRLFPSG
jgi:hypothetical protein